MAKLSVSAHRQVVAELRGICDEFEFEDIAYVVDVKDLRAYFPGASGIAVLKRSLEKRGTSFETSSRAREYLKSWARCWLVRDTNVNALFRKPTHRWQYSMESNKPNSPIINMHKYGYYHKVSLSFPCPVSDQYCGRLTALVNSEAASERVLAMDPVLMRALENFHLRLVVHHGQSVNPLVDYALVKPTSVRVLTYLATGLSRQRVAEECCITTRGVDYHIDVLKQALSAGNIAQLIGVAKDQYLI